jgi:hypothetical protein
MTFIFQGHDTGLVRWPSGFLGESRILERSLLAFPNGPQQDDQVQFIISKGVKNITGRLLLASYFSLSNVSIKLAGNT